MRADLRQRLRELGVVKGVRELAEQPSQREVAIEDLVAGHFHTTSRGQCFVAEKNYPLDHAHGDLPLGAFLELSPGVVAQVEGDEALREVALRRACFLDTETTGLSGGTGTMAFVVGLGFFEPAADDEPERFRVQQYFLRDPGDEPAMIEALAEQLPAFEALVSFNGRAFDVPIIQNRFILARKPPHMLETPHVDLLHPARRIWRYGLSSCALTALEREVLGVRREQADVPSGVIPYLYRDYLRTGDAREMQRVLYHNQVDILSLVTLAARLCRAFEHGADGDSASLSGAELYGLGRWYTDEERVGDAERAYRTALADELTPELRMRVLRELAYLLKRDERRAEAFAYWQQLALEAVSDHRKRVLAHVELAKYFEWYVKDLALAAAWTRAALCAVEDAPASAYRDELRHRLDRLERKMDG
jgi:hypothetical protein